MAQAKPREVIRLTPDVYDELVRKLIPLHVDNNTTELQAGYQLGIQKVLTLLRDGYTIGA